MYVSVRREIHREIRKTPCPWKQHTPYARVEATLTPLCGVATPILMVPEASGGLECIGVTLDPVHWGS